MPAAFASPVDLAVYLQTATQAEADAGSADVLDTAVATQALASASGAIRAACGWSISEETVTDTFPIVGGEILLPTAYLTSAAVTVAGVVVDPATVVVRRRRGSVTLPYYWSGWAEVTYTHGYDPIPDEVLAVCLEQAASNYRNPTGLAVASYGNVSETYQRESDNASLVDDYRLAAYRLPTIA